MTILTSCELQLKRRHCRSNIQTPNLVLVESASLAALIVLGVSPAIGASKSYTNDFAIAADNSTLNPTFKTVSGSISQPFSASEQIGGYQSFSHNFKGLGKVSAGTFGAAVNASTKDSITFATSATDAFNAIHANSAFKTNLTVTDLPAAPKKGRPNSSVTSSFQLAGGTGSVSGAAGAVQVGVGGAASASYAINLQHREGGTLKTAFSKAGGFDSGNTLKNLASFTINNNGSSASLNILGQSINPSVATGLLDVAYLKYSALKAKFASVLGAYSDTLNVTVAGGVAKIVDTNIQPVFYAGGNLTQLIFQLAGKPLPLSFGGGASGFNTSGSLEAWNWDLTVYKKQVVTLQATPTATVTYKSADTDGKTTVNLALGQSYSSEFSSKTGSIASEVVSLGNISATVQDYIVTDLHLSLKDLAGSFSIPDINIGKFCIISGFCFDFGRINGYSKDYCVGCYNNLADITNESLIGSEILPIGTTRSPLSAAASRLLGVTQAVPEPSTWALLFLGVFGVGAALRRQRRCFGGGLV